VTDSGSQRYYIGYSRADPSKREMSLQQPGGEYQPTWLSIGCSNFELKVTHRNIETRAAALAVEAFAAAKKWKSFPRQTRGGAWLRPTLSDDDLLELPAAAKCESLQQLFSLLERFPDGSLAKHLNGLAFKPASGKRPRGKLTPSVLAAVVRKRQSGRSTRSGRVGHAARLSNGLKYGDEGFETAKWGSNPAQARRDHWQNYVSNRVKKKPAGRVRKKPAGR
jgi:hypothetical protein